MHKSQLARRELAKKTAKFFTASFWEMWKYPLKLGGYQGKCKVGSAKRIHNCDFLENILADFIVF